MNIGLIGYGKMGKAIEAIALGKNHSIGLKADSKTVLTSDLLKQNEVIIEFTNPHSAVANIEQCLKAGVPVVVGSTGWYEHFDQVKNWVEKYDGTLLHATNFSIGVNLFFSFNAYVAGIMKNYPEYTAKIHEVHHTQKLDAPSGTAITTAETVMKHHEKQTAWVHGKPEQPNELEITHERIDNVPGTHVVTWTSEIDDLSLAHVAHNRKGFASGAIIAAEWIKGKKGIFTMKDVLGINY